MDDSPVGTIGYDGVKAWLQVVGLPGTQGFQLFCGRTLCDKRAADSGFQPEDPLGQSRPVAQVSSAFVGYLCSVLDCFGQQRRIGCRDNGAVRGGAPQSTTGLFFVQPYGAVRRKRGGIGVDPVIGSQCNSVGSQGVFQGFREHGGVDEQLGVRSRQCQKAQHHRAASHIPAAQIEQPGDVIQRRKQQDIGLPFR